MNSKHVLVVLSNCREGTDQAFNDWYDGTHLGDVFKLEGYAAAQRFKLSGTQLNDDACPYRYLALYEVDVDDLNIPVNGLNEVAGDPVKMALAPSLDMEHTVAWFYTPLGDRVAP